MKFKHSALVAAVAALSTFGAQAEMALANTGNGSMFFVAIDSQGAPISLTVDLGFNMGDFITNTSGFGSLTAPGTEVVWNFANNTRSVNGVASTGNFQWSGAFGEFVAAAQAGETQWGIVGGDSINGGAIPARGWLATGNPTQAQMVAMNTSGPVGNALGIINNFQAANQSLGTHAIAGADGASVASSGPAYLNTGMQDRIGNQQTWSYLVNASETSALQYVVQFVANPEVRQIGLETTIDSLSPTPATFTFDFAANTLTYVMPVPEPGTYALMAAGLAAVGFMARRRRAQA